MTTSWTDLQWIEKFLIDRLSPEVRAVTEQKIANDPLFNANVEAQRRLYTVIRLRGRESMRRKLLTIHDRIFNDPSKVSYKNEIADYFRH